ncbi:MAG: Palmitoyltransferase [Candelina submexicana]|nr:MAG: Palmitoyltransferase [Candelina submexicana]
MDHHCPWTANCVSHLTYPHFIRFLIYAVTAMINLEYFLSIRVGLIWDKRDLPSYLGPSTGQLALLLVLLLANSFMLFALSILLIRSLWSLGANTTTIEGWEIERHRTLLRRARVLGGSLDGPDGVRIKINRQEFPYDISIFTNIREGMGGSYSIFSWFWPFAVTPSLSSGLAFEVNGIEDPSLSWPPPDPDRIARPPRADELQNAFIYSGRQFSDEGELDAFKKRQQEDRKRWQDGQPGPYRRPPFRKRYGTTISNEDESYAEREGESAGSSGGEERWRNSEGESLGDFGVDEDVEFYDGDDLPLAVLLQRRRQRA